jgi:hypothetical protein
VASPKRDKGKKRARQPSPEPDNEWEDEGDINELIAAVDDLQRAMNENKAMDRTKTTQIVKMLEEDQHADMMWRKEQRKIWRDNEEWRTGMMVVMKTIAEALSKMAGGSKTLGEGSSTSGEAPEASGELTEASGVGAEASQEDRMVEDDEEDGEGEEDAEVKEKSTEV